MRREDGSSTNTTASTTPSLALLERLVALAGRAIEAAREGDMVAVNTLLDEREPFLAQLAGALSRRTDASSSEVSAPREPDGLPADPAEGRLAALARRDADAMVLLERGIAEARAGMTHELDALTAARAAVSGYAGDGPLAPPAGTIDVRR